MEVVLNELPPEVWSHILSYIVDFEDVIHLKVVNRLFYQDLGAVDLVKVARTFLASVDHSINLPDGKNYLNNFKIIKHHGITTCASKIVKLKGRDFLLFIYLKFNLILFPQRP